MSLEVLKKLNNVNEQNGQIIPYNSFYISELKDKVDIKSDYLSWVQQQNPVRYGIGMQVGRIVFMFTYFIVTLDDKLL